MDAFRSQLEGMAAQLSEFEVKSLALEGELEESNAAFDHHLVSEKAYLDSAIQSSGEAYKSSREAYKSSAEVYHCLKRQRAGLSESPPAEVSPVRR